MSDEFADICHWIQLNRVKGFFFEYLGAPSPVIRLETTKIIAMAID